jgi:two-component system cell cycle sensor histidine kinase/response regulator CckA
MTRLPTVLIVDDELPMRKLARRILEKDGYRVFEAGSGPEAIAFLAAEDAAPDLVMSDVHMPELGGAEMVERMRVTTPNLKVLYVSGHINTLMRDRAALSDNEAFLGKPFSATGLLEAVSLMLFGTTKRKAP